MMNFLEWLEGFGVDYANLPSGIQAAYGQLDQDSVKQQAIADLAQSPYVSYSPEDRPQDFIEITPLNQAQQLPVFNIKAKDTLPSFEGGTIYYGFKLGVPKEQIAQELQEKLKNAKAKLAELETQKSNANVRGGAGMNQAVQAVIDQEYNKLLEKGATSDHVAKYLTTFVNNRLEAEGLLQTKTDPNTGQRVPVRLGIKRVMRYINSRREERPRGVRSAKTVRNKIEAIHAEIGELEHALANRGKFINAVQQAFLRKIKFPQTPDDKALRDQIVRLAVDNYVRLRPSMPYEYIVYPESRSDLNAEIAFALAEKYNATPVQGLNKLPTDAWRMDTHSFARNYPDKETQQAAARYLQTRMPTSQGQIKNIQQHQPYIRNWQMSPNLRQQVDPAHARSGLTNRYILVIDDNIRTSGTLQAIHHVLQKVGPKRIDIYTPLWAHFRY